MVKIFIDPGHGGVDSGATGNGLLEKNVTLQIALLVRKYLTAYEHVTIKMSRTSDKTVTLSARTNEANNWGADYFLSIHINAGGGTGFESYIYSRLSSSGETAKRRNIIHNEIVKVNELRDRGKKQGNLHVLRESMMSSMLTENGFIDTKADAEKMKDKKWLETVAKAHADGLAKVFHLKKKAHKDDRYTMTKNTPGYYTAEDAKKGKNKKSTMLPGKYYIYKQASGMINITKQKGIPGSWIDPKGRK